MESNKAVKDGGALRIGFEFYECKLTLNFIIESVDSICRDGADTPNSLNKSNGSELPNADILCLFRQTTCSASASIHYNTLKIYSYSDSRKIVKTLVHHLLLLFFFCAY